MIKRFLALAGTGALLAGCYDHGMQTQPQGESTAELAYTQRELSGSTHFTLHMERQTDRGSYTERFVDCDVNGLLVGFGGRVDGDGNFTDITAFCRDLNPDRTLGPSYERTVGGTSKESYVKATDGYVVAGIGGIVNGKNLVRAVIRECQYLPATNRVDPSTCRLKSSDASTAMEKYYSVHEHILLPELYSDAALQGVGLSASKEALKAVRFTAVVFR